MSKSYEEWHRLKSRIEDGHKVPYFREGEIWWCSLGANVGVEEDGKNELFERPVLIFRKFNEQMFWAFPMTSKSKRGKFYFSLRMHNTEGFVIFSQLRTLSGKRLIRRVGKVRGRKFIELKRSFSSFINESDPFRGPRAPDVAIVVKD